MSGKHDYTWPGGAPRKGAVFPWGQQPGRGQRSVQGGQRQFCPAGEPSHLQQGWRIRSQSPSCPLAQETGSPQSSHPLTATDELILPMTWDPKQGGPVKVQQARRSRTWAQPSCHLSQVLAQPTSACPCCTWPSGRPPGGSRSQRRLGRGQCPSSCWCQAWSA